MEKFLRLSVFKYLDYYNFIKRKILNNSIIEFIYFVFYLFKLFNPPFYPSYLPPTGVKRGG
jgi:hypothetical protein